MVSLKKNIIATKCEHLLTEEQTIPPKCVGLKTITNTQLPISPEAIETTEPIDYEEELEKTFNALMWAVNIILALLTVLMFLLGKLLPQFVVFNVVCVIFEVLTFSAFLTNVMKACGISWFF